jgi:MOSC domain-containing protein
LRVPPRAAAHNGVERIGAIHSIRRYPVKSMAGEDLDEARVTPTGLAGDRVYAFVETDNQTSFPWMTARHGHDWIRFRPQFLDPPSSAEQSPSPERFAAEVVTPEGIRFRADAPEFTQYLEKRFGRSLRVQFSERSITDAHPVSIFGLSTIRGLSEETGKDLDPRRFRANFYAQWDDDRAFFEDTLIGRQLRIGDSVRVMALKKDVRCVMITLDPDDGSPFPQLLECVARNHGGCAGIYCTVLGEGIVRRNDPIWLI